jgi:hypothetical protein
MPNASLRFEVLVNGERIAVTGTSPFGVLTAIVNWVRRSPTAITDKMRNDANFDEAIFLKEVCILELGALDSMTQRHVSWKGAALGPGDEVTVRVLGAGEFDDPPLPPNKSLERTREG